MRGVAYDQFGGPEVLTLRDDLPDPPVGPDTVLVRVHAAGVNPVDLSIRAGRLQGGLAFVPDESENAVFEIFSRSSVEAAAGSVSPTCRSAASARAAGRCTRG